MNSDEERSDDYWEGVLHALRMVDSLLKWSKRNEARAKPLEQFIHDGLIAAAKRCQSCLSKKLGVAFSDEDEKIVMRPEGLLDLKLTANQEEKRNRFNIRISWQVDDSREKKKKSLSVK